MNWDDFDDPLKFNAFLSDKIQRLDKSKWKVYCNQSTGKFSLIDPSLTTNNTATTITTSNNSNNNNVLSPPKLPARPSRKSSVNPQDDTGKNKEDPPRVESSLVNSRSNSEDFSSKLLRPLPEPPKRGNSNSNITKGESEGPEFLLKSADDFKVCY